MNFFGDYHIHSLYCDGKNSPEEIVAAALELGLEYIGFSGHAHTAFDESWCMSPQGTAEYLSCLHRLREQYGGRLGILCGTELDYFSGTVQGEYDFSIGSVHYLKLGESYLPLDESPEELVSLVREHFGGSFDACAAAYYGLVEDVMRKTGCSLVGHFDLISKFNEGERLFSEQGRYKDAAFAAVDSLCAQGAIFEINTGAMSRGWRSLPYPSPDILGRIREKGGRIMLCSDCHSGADLCHGFEKARELALAAGFAERWVFTERGAAEIKL